MAFSRISVGLMSFPPPCGAQPHAAPNRTKAPAAVILLINAVAIAIHFHNPESGVHRNVYLVDTG